MIAAVGVIEKVRGSRSAIPLVPPRPGKTPMAVPRMSPASATTRLVGVSATPSPYSRSFSTDRIGID